MELNELLEKAKQRANLPSNYALAKAINVPQSTVTGWVKGRRHPSNEEAVQLATLAGLDEMQVIAEIELSTAKNEKKREFWKHFLETRTATGTLGLCILGAGILLTPEADADVLHLQDYADNQAKIYIMRNS